MIPGLEEVLSKVTNFLTRNSIPLTPTQHTYYLQSWLGSTRHFPWKDSTMGAACTRPLMNLRESTYHSYQGALELWKAVDVGVGASVSSVSCVSTFKGCGMCFQLFQVYWANNNLQFFSIVFIQTLYKPRRLLKAYLVQNNCKIIWNPVESIELFCAARVRLHWTLDSGRKV